MRWTGLIPLGIALTVAACSQTSSLPTRHASPSATPTGTAARPASAARPCPSPTPAGHPGSTSIVDYVDFVQFDGRQYLAMFASPPTLAARQLGARIGTVRCRLEDSGASPTYKAQSEDAAFLAPGTPLFALQGWPVRCRIAAKPATATRAQVFVAVQPGGTTARPVQCSDGAD